MHPSCTLDSCDWFGLKMLDTLYRLPYVALSECKSMLKIEMLGCSKD